MRLFHISDLHIGKRVCGFSMLEDQKYILRQILQLCDEEKPDGVLIAGDLYDKSLPPAEAVETVDWFLSQLAARALPTWVTSGNHDSAERVAYGSQMMEKAGIHMARVFDGRLQRFSLSDGADLYLLPFVRPAQVRRFFPEPALETTQQAVEAVLAETLPDPKKVNILMMHQFLAGASVCDSEECFVGGSDQVNVSVADRFDYVALGHLHRPQGVGWETVRYCGSPLKYSFSEAGHQKSVTVVEIAEEAAKGIRERVTVRTIPLVPRLDLREIRGPIRELLRPEISRQGNPEDYLHVTLTDEGEVPDALGRLRAVYPNVMRLDFEHRENEALDEEMILPEDKTPQELFAEFFALQNGREMDARQEAVVREALGCPKGLGERNEPGGEAGE